MVIRLWQFNSYLLAAAGLALLTGCQSAGSQHEKQVATLRVFLEVNATGTDRTQSAKISRSHPIELTVDRAPILDESEIIEARVADTVGGFAIIVSFDWRGTMLLEQYSAANPGKHLAIVAQFGEKLAETRWLAAPLINHRISEGRLGFTPDATRAEADEIVLGLNNHAKSHPEVKKAKKEKKDQKEMKEKKKKNE
ncbi:MAG: hypothetical protein EXS35_13695 [Pedosphaera sp.]|nr:hypothetical protein [Pedosphaera sp.]